MSITLSNRYDVRDFFDNLHAYTSYRNDSNVNDALYILYKLYTQAAYNNSIESMTLEQSTGIQHEMYTFSYESISNFLVGMIIFKRTDYNTLETETRGVSIETAEQLIREYYTKYNSNLKSCNTI